MVLVTAQEIAAQLKTQTYSEPLADINPYVVEDIGRKEYPSIEIENEMGQERARDVPTSKDKQTYLVHLYYRITGFGDADEPNVKLLEDEIFSSIDAFQTTSSKIYITESWKRETFNRPTPHKRSTLRVTSEEIFSEKEGGTPGDKITITFPSPLGTLDVINLINDKLDNTKDMDMESDGANSPEEIFSTIHLHGLLDVVVVLTPTQEGQLDDLFELEDDLSVTLTKNGTAFVKTANLISRVNATPRSQVQETTILMDIK